MPITIDKCPNFDGLKCPKCDRTLPDYCFDHQELERKAQAYDDMMAGNPEKPVEQTPTTEPIKRRGRPPVKTEKVIG